MLTTSALAATPVQNCDDSNAPGTLRSSIATAATGEVIDLSNLPCNGIKLVGPLTVNVADLTIKGPHGLFTLDGQYTHSRIFQHRGAGTLKLEYIAASSGLANDTTGGCIDSQGNVQLFHSQLSDCDVAPLRSTPYNTLAEGGAIYAKGSVTLTASSISGGVVNNSYGVAVGGAIAAAESVILQSDPLIPGSGSSISYSFTIGDASIGSSSAGAISSDRVFIEDSTIFSCRALRAGAVEAASYLKVVNSTFSMNTATAGSSAKYGVGAISASGAIIIESSTFANNTGHKYGALQTGPNAHTNIDSSIFANSSNPAGQAVPDIGQSANMPGTFGGSNNLIANPSPGLVGTVSGPANLTSLGDFGGRTLVHSLMPGSAALRAGSNDFGFTFDQRGQPRGRGNNVDIGAVQITDILFDDGFEPTLR
ncbi:MAG TPA: choice-of-anchor Q domain-containing protein [Rudaea sp.]